MVEVHTPSWNSTDEFSSDASGDCRAIWGNHRIQGSLASNMAIRGIAAKELLICMVQWDNIGPITTFRSCVTMQPWFIPWIN